MADHKFWLNQIRRQLDPRFNRAKRVWQSLSAEQRGVLLHAAGLPPVLCRYSWEAIDVKDLVKLRRGIQRIKALIGRFDDLAKEDFCSTGAAENISPAPVGGVEMVIAPRLLWQAEQVIAAKETQQH